jgi:protein-arginine kinase activator protein McsA
MFGNRRNYNDVFRLFDEIFEQFNQNNGGWKTQTRLSEDGTTRVTTHYWSDDKTTPKSNKGVELLKAQLEEAIENEDFELAVKLRDQIKSLELNQEEIDKLELELKKSIKEQNFEKSIEIRDQLKKLRN